MPIPPPILTKIILAVQGYTELGMAAEAHAELDAQEPVASGHPALIECRMHIFMQENRWPRAYATAEQLRRLQPHAPSAYIQGAYCLHEMGRTPEARSLLLAGPPQLETVDLYHYNMACYDAALGHLETALPHLLRSFQLNPSLQRVAQQDPDLVALRGQF